MMPNIGKPEPSYFNHQHHISTSLNLNN